MQLKLSMKKRIRNILFIAFLLMTLLIGRIGFIQFVQGKELSEMAYEQQTLDRSINPKRGTIYDCTGENILAVSSTVETVTVNPTNIKSEDKEKVAKKIYKITNKTRLPYQKIIGFKYKVFYFLSNIVPKKLFLSIVNKMFNK